jgi:glutathione synthase
MLRNEMGEDRRVAIAYFMDGYLPEHFQSEAEWKTRLEMEQSEAVIQPNIFVYFAGTKTIQQALTEPGAMERFFPEAKEETQEGRKLAKNLTALRATFIDQWGLGSGSAEEEAEVKKAIANPGRYVLKCNREGGKGNYFGEDLKKELERMTVEQRGEYILQRKIEPFYAKVSV